MAGNPGTAGDPATFGNPATPGTPAAPADPATPANVATPGNPATYGIPRTPATSGPPATQATPTAVPAPEPASRPRFAQLTYASAERAGHAGGWQVQHTVGELSTVEREYLTRRISPRFAPAADVPGYLAAEEVHTLPSRLVYGPVPDGGVAYWHTAPCGPDAQGRPGNVFVHVLLDRAPGRPGSGPRRPSDLLLSPHWLRPFGPDAVATADLHEVPALPWSPAPDREEVLAFLFGDSARDIGVFCLLLDAVYAAIMGSGPPVALGVRDERTGPWWVAAVGHLMSPEAAYRFHWSTSERLADRAHWPTGAHLVVVPSAEVAAAPNAPDRLVLLDEQEQVRRADLGRGPRETVKGCRVGVTAWSVLTYELSALSDPVGTVLARMEEIAAEVDGVELDPAWPMAMAVAEQPEQLADAMPAAEQVISAKAPAALGTQHPELFAQTLTLAEQHIGPTTADAWRAMHEAGPEQAIPRINYLLRALGDKQWLLRPNGAGTGDPELDLGGEPPLVLRTEARERLRELEGRRQRPDPDAELVALSIRVGDLLARARLDEDGRLPDLWRWAADRLLQPGLREEVPDLLHGWIGPGAVLGLSWALNHRLVEEPERAGSRVRLGVLDLLQVRLPRPADYAGLRRPSALQRELAACLNLVDPDPWSRAWLTRAWDLLDQLDGGPAGELPPELRPEETARPGHLVVLLSHDRPEPLSELIHRTLLGARPGAETDDLVAAVLGPGPSVRALTPPGQVAYLRRLVDAGSLEPADRATLLGYAGRALAGAWPEAVAPSIWRTVLAARAAEMVARFQKSLAPRESDPLPPEVVHALRERLDDPDGSAGRLLASAPDLASGGQLVLAALCCRFPSTGGEGQGHGELVTPGPEFQPVVDGAVRTLLRTGRLTEADRDEGFGRFREARTADRPRTWRLRADHDDAIDRDCRTWWFEITRHPGPHPGPYPGHRPDPGPAAR